MTKMFIYYFFIFLDPNAPFFFKGKTQPAPAAAGSAAQLKVMEQTEEESENARLRRIIAEQQKQLEQLKSSEPPVTYLRPSTASAAKPEDEDKSDNSRGDDSLDSLSLSGLKFRPLNRGEPTPLSE